MFYVLSVISLFRVSCIIFAKGSIIKLFPIEQNFHSKDHHYNRDAKITIIEKIEKNALGSITTITEICEDN